MEGPDGDETANVLSTTAADSATTRALETPELLENVLLYLPLNEILFAQRVCRFWKASIETSANAQRVLYYRPLSDGHVSWRFVKGWRMHLDDDRPMRNGRWHMKGRNEQVQPALNPLMRRFFITEWIDFYGVFLTGFVVPIFNPEAYQDEYMEIGEDIGPRSMHELHTLHRAQSSWKNMLLMQPPCHQINFACDVDKELLKIRNKTGVTLGDVVKALRDHWNNCPSCPLDSATARWDFEGFQKKDVCVYDNAEDGWSVLLALQGKGGALPRSDGEHVLSVLGE